MLDVRRLRILHAVARYGSVTSAARALAYSGPAVSQQLAALEREVGLTMVERVGRGVRLTPAARLLVAHTDALLAQLEAAEADLAALHDQVSGAVRLAAFGSAARALVPPAWARLRRQAPGVDLDLVEMEPAESLLDLRRDGIDVAVVYEYDSLPLALDPQLDRWDISVDQVLLAEPVAGADAGGDPVELRSLRGADFVAPRSGTDCAEMTMRACGAAGFVPRFSARANDFGVLLALVAAGVGVALVPRLAAEPVPPGVTLRPLAQPVARRVVVVVRSGGQRRPAIRLLLDELSREAGSAAAGSAPNGIASAADTSMVMPAEKASMVAAGAADSQ